MAYSDPVSCGPVIYLDPRLLVALGQLQEVPASPEVVRLPPCELPRSFPSLL
jgi:hypothetical protein